MSFCLGNTGFILLSGGKSSRMGSPKAQLPYQGTTFINYIIQKANRMGFGDIYISSNQPILGHKPINDINIGIGPIEGIYQCLHKSNYKKNLIVPVDIPQLPESLMIELVKKAQDKDSNCVFLKKETYIEPLIAVFDKDLYMDLGKMIKDKNYRVRDVIHKSNADFVEYTGNDFDIKNINTPEDYKMLQSR